MFRLSDGEEIMTLAFFVLIQYRSVTDRRTDGQTDILPLAIPAVCIAGYAKNALVIEYVRYVSSSLDGRGPPLSLWVECFRHLYIEVYQIKYEYIHDTCIHTFNLLK